MLGVVVGSSTRTGSRTRSRYAVGGDRRASMLLMAVNGQMLGHPRLAYSLATNRQIPSARRAAAPAAAARPTWRSSIAGGARLRRWRCRTTSSFLAGIFAFGAMLAFAIAHLSVIVLRFREPDRPSAFRVPLSFTVRRRARCRCPPSLGALFSVGWRGSA